jgi:hypothetical protein
MNSRRIAKSVRTSAMLMVIALQFTNLFQFIARGGAVPNSDPRSAFIVDFASYGICILLLMIDVKSVERLVRKRIFFWALGAIGLFTWGMLVRTFNSPAGINDYDFLHEFGIAVADVVFIVSCVFIFDDSHVLALARKAVVLATIAAAVLNIYDICYPGFFSSYNGRAAGLYVNPNTSGMALVLGCIIGLPSLHRTWSREAFLLVTLIGVLTTFSRAAIIASVIVIVSLVSARRLAFHRLLLMLCCIVVVFITFNIARDLRSAGIIQADADLTKTFRMFADSSAQERAADAWAAAEEFEAAPLLGHGFGTTAYWTWLNQSHDFYLSSLADYGIMGIFLIPGLVYSLWRRSWDCYAFSAVFVLSGFFNHMLLTDPFSLVCLAIEADEADLHRSPETLTSRRFTLVPFRPA